MSDDHATLRAEPQCTAWTGESLQRRLVLVAAVSSLLLANMPLMVKEAEVLGLGETRYAVCVYSPLPPRGNVPETRYRGLFLIDPVKNNAYGLLAAGLVMLCLVRPGCTSLVAIAVVGAYFFVVFARTIGLHFAPPLHVEFLGEKVLLLIGSVSCWSVIAAASLRRWLSRG